MSAFQARAAEGFRWGRTASLAALAFVLPLSLAASNILWVAALACVAGLWAADPASRVYRRTGLEFPWAVYLAVEVATAALSVRPGHSLGKVSSEILVVLFLLYAQSPSESRRHIGFFLSGAALAGGLGVAQKALGFSWNDFLDLGIRPGWAPGWPPPVLRLFSLWRGRAVGFYSHPVTYAEMLLPALTLALASACAAPALRGQLNRRASAVKFFAVLGGVAASGTRAVWMAVPASLALWAAVRRDRRIAAAAAAVVAAALVAGALSPEFRRRVASVADLKANPSNLIRRGVWLASVKVVLEHPIAGVGIGNLHIPGRALRWGGAAPDSDWTETHNIYLQMAVERGLPGLAVFLWLLACYGRLLWKAAAADRLWNGLFFGFVGLAFAGLTESWTHDSEIMMCFYFLLGSAAAASAALPPQVSRPPAEASLRERIADGSSK